METLSEIALQDFAFLAAQVVGELDVVNPYAEPYPWFCKDIHRKKDVQWAGYIGPISVQEEALVFGINLEFTGAWRKAYPKIESQFSSISELLTRYKNLEWHWMGRPGVIARNPETRWLSPRIWTFQVDLQHWVHELEDILDRKTMWSATAPMRPQMQIMRHIGLPSQFKDSALIRQNIEQTVLDLWPVVEFMGKP
jgi:hypothetical protein